MARLRPSLKAAWGSGRVTGPSAHRQGDPGDASLMLGWAGPAHVGCRCFSDQVPQPPPSSSCQATQLRASVLRSPPPGAGWSPSPLPRTSARGVGSHCWGLKQNGSERYLFGSSE